MGVSWGREDGLETQRAEYLILRDKGSMEGRVWGEWWWDESSASQDLK